MIIDSPMQKMFSYATDGHHATVAGMRVELDAPIDMAAMQEALSLCCERQPYLKAQFEQTGESIQIVIGDEPLKLHEDAPDYLPDLTDNNNCLLRFSANSALLTISMFHAWGDGGGIALQLRALLAEYYRLKGCPVELPASLQGMGEASDPFVAVPANMQPPAPEAPQPFFVVPADPAAPIHLRTFSADSSAIMDYAHAVDGSPNAVGQVALAKAIARVWPEAAEEGISVSVTINAKPIVGVPDMLPPCLSGATLRFDAELLGRADELLHLYSRGRVFADCTEEKLLPRMAGSKMFAQMLDAAPTLQAKHQMAAMTVETPYNSASVSYAGVPKLGPLEEHICSMNAFAESATPVLEISYLNGHFFFALSEHSADPALAQTLRDVLIEQGLECTPLEELELR